jgi:alpha-N-arabinofuranosidase
MDGPWQLGHVPADHYAIRAQQAAKLMKDVDASIEVVACGSSGIGLDTYMDWDRQVLEHLGDQADYISLHRYAGNREHDTPDYLAITRSIDRQIEEMDAACRFVQAKKRSAKRPYLCFDEWNVWYKNMQTDGAGQHAPHLVEEVYNLEDALVAAGSLNSFIRHAGMVRIANLAQIVNVIAPLVTRGDQLLIQSIFYIFEMYSRRRAGVSLQPVVAGPTYDSRTHGPTPYLDTSAILNGDRLHIFATNRSLDQALPLAVSLADRGLAGLDEAEVLTGPNAEAANSFEQPDLILPRPFAEARLADGRAELELPPLSLTAMTFRLR